MNSIAKQAWSFLMKNPLMNSSLQAQQFQQVRGIQVRVRNNNLDQALTIMERRMRQSGMERLIKRFSMKTHHIKNSEKRIIAQKNLQRKLKSQDLARKLQSILIKKVRCQNIFGSHKAMVKVNHKKIFSRAQINPNMSPHSDLSLEDIFLIHLDHSFSESQKYFDT
ncbi:hypothetical protein AQUCO_02000419v1 [Aquilegia coerulea]|uniref:Ribosomal protein S21 n=1 Tax=Aquilegia coerulea TaxID=218851 RepID=A0A2G5DHI1_AQUCA|nr:hypothetical protein AQUCO_02000419v1 [Aquilegia coerulea]